MIDELEVPLRNVKSAWLFVEFESFKLFYLPRKNLGVEHFADVLI